MLVRNCKGEDANRLIDIFNIIDFLKQPVTNKSFLLDDFHLDRRHKIAQSTP